MVQVVNVAVQPLTNIGEVGGSPRVHTSVNHVEMRDPPVSDEKGKHKVKGLVFCNSLRVSLSSSVNVTQSNLN